jgi:hypothetical protein
VEAVTVSTLFDGLFESIFIDASHAKTENLTGTQHLLQAFRASVLSSNVNNIETNRIEVK